MKTNLSTFPKPKDYNWSSAETLDACYEWKEKLAKDLQQIEEDYKNHGELRYSTIELVKQLLGPQKEILGQ